MTTMSELLVVAVSSTSTGGRDSTATMRTTNIDAQTAALFTRLFILASWRSAASKYIALKSRVHRQVGSSSQVLELRSSSQYSDDDHDCFLSLKTLFGAFFVSVCRIPIHNVNANVDLPRSGRCLSLQASALLVRVSCSSCGLRLVHAIYTSSKGSTVLP